MEYKGDKSLIQNMPIQIAIKWACKTPSPTNDLALMEDLMTNGFKDPLILGVGIYSRKVRLDTGNHRIHLAPRLGMTHVPVVARVSNYCVFLPHNGDHSYDCPFISRKKEWIDEEYYTKPSDVLDMMEILKNSL